MKQMFCNRVLQITCATLDEHRLALTSCFSYYLHALRLPFSYAIKCPVALVGRVDSGIEAADFSWELQKRLRSETVVVHVTLTAARRVFHILY